MSPKLDLRKSALALVGLVLVTNGAPQKRMFTEDDVVFCLGSSAAVFPQRLDQFLSIWWRKGLHGTIWVDEISKPVSTAWDKARERVRAGSFQGLQLAASSKPEPGAAWAEGWVNPGERIGWSQTMDAIQAHPDAAWYILGDDDTIFNVDNLLLILQPLNPSEMVYIGGTNHEAVAYLAAAGRSAPEEGAIFAYGGGGVVISTALMHQLTLDMLSCMAAQRSSIGGDDRIGHCVQRIGGKLTIHPGFHQVDYMNPIKYFESHPQAPMVTFHHFPLVQRALSTMNFTLHTFEAAVHADPHSFLQQTVCHFDNLGSFAISSAFSVRWWDSPINATDLAGFIPFHDHLPRARFIFTPAKATDSPLASQSRKTLTYRRILAFPSHPSQEELEWMLVRVIQPVLQADRWFKGAPTLCCAAADARLNPGSVDITLKECGPPSA